MANAVQVRGIGANGRRLPEFSAKDILRDAEIQSRHQGAQENGHLDEFAALIFKAERRKSYYHR